MKLNATTTEKMKIAYALLHAAVWGASRSMPVPQRPELLHEVVPGIQTPRPDALQAGRQAGDGATSRRQEADC